MLSAKPLYDSFKLKCMAGMYSNYTKLKDSVMLEIRRDVLYFDGILLEMVVKTFKYFSSEK